MRSKERRNTKSSTNKGSGAPRAQADIASITSKSSPVRRIYDAKDLRPAYTDMIARSMPGIDIAGTMARGVLSLNGTAPDKAREVATGFRDNHPDVIARIGEASSIVINGY